MDNGACSYRRFLSGDDKGIVEIVSEYKDGLILYLDGYVNNIYIAEELAEDTFFRLITKKPKFKGQSSFKSWLYAIGRNIAVDYLRKNGKNTITPIEDMESYLSDQKNLESSYIKTESRSILHKALDSLNTDYKTVLWLSYFEDFSNSEISVALKKNDRQVRNLLYRAKQALKEKLSKEGFDFEEL